MIRDKGKTWITDLVIRLTERVIMELGDAIEEVYRLETSCRRDGYDRMEHETSNEESEICLGLAANALEMAKIHLQACLRLISKP